MTDPKRAPTKFTLPDGTVTVRKFLKPFKVFRNFSVTTRLRMVLLLPLVSVITLLLCIWIKSMYAQQHLLISQGAKWEQLFIENTYREQITLNVRLLEALSESIKHNMALRNAFKSRDREELLRLLLPLNTEMKRKFGVTHFYFIDTDRVCFLRVHKPDFQGGVIDRVTTLNAERTGTPSYGIELGVLGTTTLRLVTPWRESGHLIGYFELGIELNQILQSENKLSKVPMFILIYKEFLNRDDWEKGMRMLERESNWDKFPDLVMIDQITKDMPEPLSTQIAKLRPSTELNINIFQEGPAYLFVNNPIIDVSGRHIGNLVAIADVSPYLAVMRNELRINALIAVFVSLLVIGLFQWITRRVGQKLENTQKELKQLAVHDGLTGLFNHREFRTRLDDELARGLRFNRPVSLLMLDVDHFKFVNDTYGHVVGDAVLKSMSDIICSQVRDIDSVCRYGGEEIVIVMPEADINAATDLAERLRSTLEAFLFEVTANALHVTVSIGVASWPAHAESALELIEAADVAMYAAKKRGRNCVVPYDPALNHTNQGQVR